MKLNKTPSSLQEAIAARAKLAEALVEIKLQWTGTGLSAVVLRPAQMEIESQIRYFDELITKLLAKESE